jgi:hypothetical protein
VNNLTTNHVKRGIAYEKRKAHEHGACHVGGPGMHDYQRGNVKGEVKARQTPVTKPELQRLIRQKGVCEVDSKAGFTQPAIDYRDRHQPYVNLISRRRRI